MTQVTSLPLSKELWEKGLRIETEWAWYHSNKINEWRVFHKREDLCKSCEWVCNEFKGDSKISAPSTDELLAVIPKTISKDGNSACLEIRMHNNTNDVCYYHPHYFVSETDKILSEAIGKMCLWLLSNGYNYEEKEKCLTLTQER